MVELQRSIWLLSTPMNAEKNRAMPVFTEVKYQMSNHQKDLSLSRIQKDRQNSQKMLGFPAESDPFHFDTVIINLNSGEEAEESVNAFQAQAIEGYDALTEGRAGTSAFDYKSRKEDMVIIIKTNVSFNIEDSIVEVDPRLLFQRLLVFIQLEEINDAFSYELCIRPNSLFDKKYEMNEAHKSELKNILLDQLGLSKCICLISFKIPIMFLMGVIVAKTSMNCWKHV